MEKKTEMTEEQLKKSIEALVNDHFPAEESTEASTEEVSKANKEEAAEKKAKAKEEKFPGHDEDANGGEDKIKSGSPVNKKQAMKSLTITDESEIELIHAWRAEQNASEEEVLEETEKSLKESNEVNLVKSLKEAFSAEMSELKKSINDKDDLIKAMSAKIEVLANQPAYDTKSITSLEAIEKSEQTEKTISKSQVLNTMLEMQVSGKLEQASRYIAEFEGTGNISNPVVKKLVFDTLSNK